MNNTVLNHTTDVAKRMDNTTSHQTSVAKHRDTSLAHTTDTYLSGSLTASHTTDALIQPFHAASHSTSTNKRKDPLLTHTTDIYKRIAVIVTHHTDANKRKDPLVTHTTDATLTPIGRPSTAQTLGVQSTLSPSINKPEFSKNAPHYISIGGGLSAMVGLPRIATWNTAGRPVKPKRGATGFNNETKKLEVWDGATWHGVALNKI